MDNHILSWPHLQSFSNETNKYRTSQSDKKQERDRLNHSKLVQRAALLQVLSWPACLTLDGI